MSFYEAFAEVIGLEGGYVNDPDDAGGETKYGISKRAYPHVDIANLTLDDARDIYYNDYWNKLNCGSMPHASLASEVFEQGVNLGVKRAAQHVQLGVFLLGQSVKIDGIIGPQTLQAVGRVRWQDLYKTLNGLQFVRYFEIVMENPSQGKFFRGWLKRIS